MSVMRPMEKISRVRRRFISGLFEKAWDCVRVDQGSHPAAVAPCSPADIRAAFDEYRTACLRWWGQNSYSLIVGSRLVFNFESFAPDSATALHYGPRIYTRDNPVYVDWTKEDNQPSNQRRSQ